jgi:hypothetical protein
MKPKQIVLGAIIVAGVVISAYLWTTTDVGSAQGDESVMSKPMNFTCPSCNGQFTKTVDQARAERQANDGNVICPHCQAAGGVKTDAVVNLGGPVLGEDEAQDAEPDDEALKATPAGARVKKTE